jgi:hypothetical protein
MRYVKYLSYLSFAIRPVFLLVVGLTVGYFFGFSDAFREGNTIGSRVSVALGKATPEEMRVQREVRAAALRDTIRARSGVINPEINP